MTYALFAGLCIVFFFGLVVMAVWLSWRYQQKEKARKREMTEALGFRPVEIIEEPLRERLISLQRKMRASNLGLSNVFHRYTPDGDVYLFDVWSRDSEGSRTVARNVFAIFSPSLDLPRFTIFPKIDMPGSLAGVGNRFLGWMMTRAAPEITFPGHPFSDHYILTGEDQAAIEKLFFGPVIDALAKTSNLRVEGSGDALSVSRLNFRTDRKRFDLPALTALYDQLFALLNLFAAARA